MDRLIEQLSLGRVVLQNGGLNLLGKSKHIFTCQKKHKTVILSQHYQWDDWMKKGTEISFGLITHLQGQTWAQDTFR